MTKAALRKMLEDAGFDLEPDPNDRRYVDAKTLARRYGISRQGIYNLMSAGMPSVSIGRNRRFDPVLTDAWIAERNNGGPA